MEQMEQPIESASIIERKMRNKVQIRREVVKTKTDFAKTFA